MVHRKEVHRKEVTRRARAVVATAASAWALSDWALSAWALSVSAAWAGAPTPSCLGAGSETARIAALEPRLELRLADGRLLRLVGLDPAAPTPDHPDFAETARARLAASWVGRTVALRVITAAPDRWGRVAAVVGPIDDPASPGAAGGLAAQAIAAGFGRYLAEPAAHACRNVLLAAEAQARGARRGLWDDPYDSVLAVDDRGAFAERAGTDVIAEGRLTAVRSAPYRTTLRFAATQAGSYAGHLLVATIVPRVMKTFEAQQMDPRTLIGRRLRFRGLLDLKFGPQIELAGPDAVELVEPAGVIADVPPIVK